jgi:hypothetical protein
LQDTSTVKQSLKLLAYILLTGVAFVMSCQKELTCYDCNNAPEANAGADQKITIPLDSAMLDGSASIDPDGKINEWLWTKLTGPATPTIVNATSPTTFVKNLAAGVYSFELKVTDDKGASATDTVQIILDNPLVNQPPVADAGAEQTVTLPADSATLDGSKSIDPDNNITAYSWTKIAGPQPGTIANANVAQTRIKGLVQGVYELELTVTDAGGLFAKDTVKVTVAASSNGPVADAGPDQIITLPASTAVLDGSKSTDPDNNITTYNWSHVLGSSAVDITDANASVTPVSGLKLGVYEFELKVTDAVGLSSTDRIRITVNRATVATTCGEANRPVINARLIPVGKLSNPASGMAVTSAGNKIFFAGAAISGNPPNYGSATVDIFDVATQSSSTAALSDSKANVAAITAGNKIFFAGGRLGGTGNYNYFSSVDIYDISTNKWSVANLSQPRAYIEPATVGNKVFFAGGEQKWPDPVSDRVDIYDLSTNSWSTSSLSVQRNGLTAVAANNKIYFAGGSNQLNGTNNVTKVIDVYDNSSNAWSTSTLSEPKSFFAGVNVRNKIYWAGGDDGSGTPTCKVEIRDLTTQTSSAAYLSYPYTCVIDEGQNAVIKDDKIVWFTVIDPVIGVSTDKFTIYNTTSNTWSIGLLPVKVSGASVISVNNNIYVAGGYINGKMSDQIWKLDF